MARPRDLPRKGWKHGTRACYVAMKCRCDPCRKANREYAAVRNRLAVEAAEAVRLRPVPPTQPQAWMTPGGVRKVRFYKRACLGPDGQGCPHKSHLRKDSKGGVCKECRKKLIWNGLVPARRARKHLLALSAQNVGKRAVAGACDVALSVLVDIRSGKKRKIRAETERRILSVDKKAVSNHALVPAAETWQLVDLLLKEHYFTRGEISQALGNKTPALLLGKKFVLASTVLKVQKLYRLTVAGETTYEKTLCPACRSHHEDEVTLKGVTAERRRHFVLGLLPDTIPNIMTKLVCLYGLHKNKLRWDLREMGALPTGGLGNDGCNPIWCLDQG